MTCHITMMGIADARLGNIYNNISRRYKTWLTLLLALALLACATAWLCLLVAEQSALISTQDAMLREFRQQQQSRHANVMTAKLRELPPQATLERDGNRRRRQRHGQQQRLSVVDPFDSPHRVQHLYTDAAGRPSLDSLISRHNQTIIGNVEFLLQIAIIGFGKCGTTSLMHWLGAHPQVNCLLQEIWALMHSRPDELVKHLYLGLPPARFIVNATTTAASPLPQAQPQHCYKCPGDILERHILDYYRQYWPRTKLIIGIRHPYEWFTSLYNFRIQNLPPDQTMKHPNDLIGRCTAGMFLTCTEKGNYAYYLLKLGKQNIKRPTTYDTVAESRRHELEEEIVGTHRQAWYNVSALEPIPNQVFLFDMKQLNEAKADVESANSTPLFDQNAHGAIFRRDVQGFLGLATPLPPLPHFRPGRVISDSDLQGKLDALKINDICDAEYTPIRTELLRLARVNSEWIRTVFVHLPTVTVNNPKHFDELLLQWMLDPCEKIK